MKEILVKSYIYKGKASGLFNTLVFITATALASFIFSYILSQQNSAAEQISGNVTSSHIEKKITLSDSINMHLNKTRQNMQNGNTTGALMLLQITDHEIKGLMMIRNPDVPCAINKTVDEPCIPQTQSINPLINDFG